MEDNHHQQVQYNRQLVSLGEQLLELLLQEDPSDGDLDHNDHNHNNLKQRHKSFQACRFPKAYHKHWDHHQRKPYVNNRFQQPHSLLLVGRLQHLHLSQQDQQQEGQPVNKLQLLQTL